MKRTVIGLLVLLAAWAAAAEEVRLSTLQGTLHGTLLVPPRVPVALIIAGSGPTDRDGNSKGLPGANNSLRLLAETLAENGIATLRYDKRGIGGSAAAGGAEAALRFDHLVNDAAGWIRQLRKDPRFSTITVIGHSEGSLIGMLAARDAQADAFVSIAGAGRTAPEILRAQLKPQLPKELWDESERILGKLTAGQTADAVPPPLAALYRPSVQPYLISWFAHDPAKVMASLTVPVLVIHGTTDIQTTRADAEALRLAAKTGELALIAGMNHVLKKVDEDRGRQVASYSDPALPLHPELGPRVAAFILGVRRR